MTLVTDPESELIVVPDPEPEHIVVLVESGPGPAGPQGPQGPEGPEGPEGPRGPTGAIGDVEAVEPLHYDIDTNTISIDTSNLGTPSYKHIQSAPLSVWTITHNLGTTPSVTVIDSANEVVLGGTVDYIDLNTLQITFGSPFSGSAYLI